MNLLQRIFSKHIDDIKFLGLALATWLLGGAIYNGVFGYGEVKEFIEGIGVEVGGLAATLLVLRLWWGKMAQDREQNEVLKTIAAQLAMLQSEILELKSHSLNSRIPDTLSTAVSINEQNRKTPTQNPQHAEERAVQRFGNSTDCTGV